MTTCIPKARVRRIMVAKLGLPLGERVLYRPALLMPTCFTGESAHVLGSG